MDEILTSRFSVRPSVHARLALARRSVRFWMALALPLLILIIAGCYFDTRLFYVAAVIAFILFPTLLLIAWNSLLTRRSAVNAMFPQTVMFSRDDEISVRYYPLPPSKSEGAAEPVAPSKHPAELIIPASSVTDCHIFGDYLDIVYSGNNDLLIPLASFPRSEMVAELLQRFGAPLA